MVGASAAGVEPRDERASSGGSGESTVDFARRSTGCAKRIRCACRNIRLSPCRASALFQAKSPYLSSPASGKPRCVRWTRIWCVRPVSSSASSSATGGSASRPPADQPEDGARRAARRASTRTRRSPSPVTNLVSDSSTARTRVAPLAADQDEIALVDRARRAAARATRSAPRASWRPAARPRCRGRAGGRARETRASGRALPQPLDQRRGDAAAAVDGETGGLVQRDQRVVLEQDRRQRGPRRPAPCRRRVAGAAARIGGTRSRSPDASRASGPTRRRLTRTSPLRRIR